MRISNSIIAVTNNMSCQIAKRANSRAISLKDTKEFLIKLRQDIERDEKIQSVTEVAGVIAISVTVVTDAIMDIVDIASSDKDPKSIIIKNLIMPIYGEARKRKWEGNDSKKYIDNIGIITKDIDKWKFGPDGDMVRKTVKVFVGMAQNFVGLIAFMKSTKEARSSLGNSISSLNKQIENIEKEINAALKKASDAGKSCVIIENCPIINLG